MKKCSNEISQNVLIKYIEYMNIFYWQFSEDLSVDLREFKEFKGEHSECIKFVGKNNSNFGFREIANNGAFCKEIKNEAKGWKDYFQNIWNS